MNATRRENARFAGTDPGTGPNRDSFTAREAHVRESFWKKFAKAAGRIPFAEDLVAAYYCALDPKTPFKVRSTLLGALAYFILPVDALPDFVLGLGFTDDAAVLAAAVSMVANHIAPRHREAAAKALETAPHESAESEPGMADTIDLEAEETGRSV